MPWRERHYSQPTTAANQQPDTFNTLVQLNMFMVRQIQESQDLSCPGQQKKERAVHSDKPSMNSKYTWQLQKM